MTTFYLGKLGKNEWCYRFSLLSNGSRYVSITVKATWGSVKNHGVLSKLPNTAVDTQVAKNFLPIPFSNSFYFGWGGDNKFLKISDLP